MKLLQRLLNKFNGLHYPQEYLCLSQETFEQPLHAFLFGNGRVIKDITNHHLFIGYSPLILVLSAQETGSDIVEIILTNQSLQPNDKFSQKDAIALLRLEKIHDGFKTGNIQLYQGIHGEHRFISRFHQDVIGLNNRLHNKKKGNVFLPDNLYKQVQVAYALPRNISLITTGQGKLFNLFPTDLHGPPDETHYLISLRFSGKACRQVENFGKILVSRILPDFYKTVYGLGKNHMQDLKPKENFPFGEKVSPMLGLPVPTAAISFRELELLDDLNHGIHKLMLFKVLSNQVLTENPSTLCHIHNVYATWRHNNRLPGNYLLR